MFDFKQHCCLCGNQKDLPSCSVRTFEFQQKILEICDKRKDEWALEVRCRFNSVNDLPAAEAIYHRICCVNFRTGRSVPQSVNDNQESHSACAGRPENFDRKKCFQEIIKNLEEDYDAQITVKDLVALMEKDCLEGAYSAKYMYMKKLLVDHFGENIVISELNGKADVITFRSRASCILEAFYQNSKGKDNPSKDDIIKTAAQLIKNENSICRKKANLKIAAIGQSLVQAARPRGIIL